MPKSVEHDDHVEQRPVWAWIDQSALRHNARRAIECAAGRSVIGVVKADGYGHGAEVVARALLAQGVSRLAVVSVAEGSALRRAGIVAPILLFGGLESGAAGELRFQRPAMRALLILALTGDFSGVIVLAILCGAVAGNLDNIVRPRLVGKDTEMHDLFVLFGTLGGLSMFGILGIIIGPIVAALFITIWEIYGDVFKNYLPNVEVVLKKRQASDPTDNGPADENLPG